MSGSLYNRYMHISTEPSMQTGNGVHEARVVRLILRRHEVRVLLPTGFLSCPVEASMKAGCACEGSRVPRTSEGRCTGSRLHNGAECFYEGDKDMIIVPGCRKGFVATRLQTIGQHHVLCP